MAPWTVRRWTRYAVAPSQTRIPTTNPNPTESIPVTTNNSMKPTMNPPTIPTRTVNVLSSSPSLSNTEFSSIAGFSDATDAGVADDDLFVLFRSLPARFQLACGIWSDQPNSAYSKPMSCRWAHHIPDSVDHWGLYRPLPDRLLFASIV